MDPYYEQLGFSAKALRRQFMPNIIQKFVNTPSYHGPGSCQGTDQTGWRTNNQLDPIISRYDLIYPWRPSYVRPKPNQWIIYNTPNEITDRIGVVKFARYTTNAGYYANLPNTQLDTLHPQRPNQVNPANPAQPATDMLYCFEGGTGAVRENNQNKDSEKPAAWSMMGFALAELGDANAPYNVHIVFRGSRSGKLRKRKSRNEFGNPDWVTDLQWTKLVSQSDSPSISEVGKWGRGFARSVQQSLPNIMTCLIDIQRTQQKPPRSISVTGHSLGAALAVQFASTMILGNRNFLPMAFFNQQDLDLLDTLLQEWPWRTMDLTTFSGPFIGNKEFNKVFNVSLASKRIWLEADPVVRRLPEKKKNWFSLSQHVGLPYKLSLVGAKNKLLKFSSHEPAFVRRFLIQDLQKMQSNLQNVPINKEPMNEFKSFTEVVNHFSNLRVSLQIRTDFGNYLGSYFESLRTSLQAFHPSKSNKISSFNSLIQLCRSIENQPLNNQQSINSTRDTIKNTWKSQAWLQTEEFTEEKDLYDFIGTCLLLLAANKDQGLYTAVKNLPEFNRDFF